MMAEHMDSDACVGFKRRIAEIEETLFPQQQELSNSISTISTQESLKESSFIDSSPEKDQEIMQDIPSPSSSKKVKCSFTEPHESIEENQSEEKVIPCDLVSGSFECEENSEDFARKVENFGVQLQETKNCVVGFVSNGENCPRVIDGPVKDVIGDKERVCAEGEVGFSEVVELDKHGVPEECKAIDMEMASFVEEKKEIFMMEETETQSLLEAKKKQLLAKLEDGSILKDKILGSLKGIDECIRPSLKVEVIDDTALIEAVPVPKTGNGGVKIAEMNGKKNEKQETDGKKARRPRRRGKDGKNVLEPSDKQKKMVQIGKVINKLSQVGEAQNCSQKNGDQLRKYSREELEALRFVNIVEQRKLWRNIYTGLGDADVKEYDGLASSRQQKNTRLNFDPRQHFGRKENTHRITGEVSSENGEIELENMEEDEIENLCHLDPAFSQNVRGEDANTSFKGECNEEEDSDEDYASIQRPAFLVEGEPDFDSGPPEDGWEYLRRVRWEAAHIPKVKVAKLERSKVNKEQSIYMPQIPEIAKCPENLMPLKQWEDAFLADFSELRMLLSSNEGSSTEICCKLQSMAIVHEQNTSSTQLAESIILEKFNNLRTDEVHSQKLLDGSCLDNTIDQPSEANAEDSKILGCSQNTSPISSVTDSSCNYPTLSAISAMDSVARVSMLRKRISSAEAMSTLSKNDCIWLFALCATVDTPLDADTSAAIRSLLRKCASLRAAKSELDDEVIMLNILATISGRYFGQSET